MGKFGYKIIIDDLPQSGVGNGIINPDILVVHHTAYESEGNYDVIERLSKYANDHMARIKNNGLAYHFYIPRMDTDENIYITRYLNQIQWHSSNDGFNSRSVAVLVEGHFETQEPTKIQLNKLKQLLDDLESNRLFPDNPYIRNLHPKDNKNVRSEDGKIIKGALTYHSEIADDGYGTDCCGKNLIKYVLDYRDNAGKVNWDNKKSFLSKLNLVKPNQSSNLQKELDEARVSLKGLIVENTNLQKEIESLRNILGENSNDIKNRLDKVIRENTELIDENKRLKQQINSDLPIRRSLTQKQNPIKEFKLKFMRAWNRLPVFVRYLIPNIISLGIPSIILYIENFNLSSIEILGVIGFSHSALKSLIIGYLKNLDKQLRGYVDAEFSFEE